MTLTIIDAGPFSTVQDEGRWGYQAFGMPVAGAMDRHAYRVANLLAGNRRGAAALEMTLRGGAFRFDRDCLAAICGADMGATLNGRPLDNWASFRADGGDELRMDFAASGCRAYLAVQGGIDVPRVLGSRSTHARAGIGGHRGRELKAGDVLAIGTDFESAPAAQRIDPAYIPEYAASIQLRAMPGPQDDHFTAAALGAFFSATFTISSDADRMGCRLDGPALEHAGPAEIISDALCTGSVQVPGHGRPIVLMADRQTTGGYPKIATVIGPDLARLAQGRPGDSVRFIRCTEEEALTALNAERDIQDAIARRLREYVLRMEITIDGVKYRAEVREG